MKRPDAGDLTVLCAIARHGSFRRAANELGLTPSALSHAMRSFESRLGLRLLSRTTRSVALTEAGARLAARAAPALRELADSLSDARATRDSPRGALRISCPRAAARLVMVPLIARFVAAFPDIAVELSVDDRMVDIVAAGFDAGVRLREILAADMIAVEIGGRQRSAVVAHPDYLARHPAPTTPRELRQHRCIRYRFEDGSYYRWQFRRGKVELAVEVDGPLTVCDEDLMVDAALEGAGLAYVFERQVDVLLASGSLVRVLEPWCPPEPGFFLYYPNRRLLPPPLRAFIDFARPRRTRDRR